MVSGRIHGRQCQKVGYRAFTGQRREKGLRKIRVEQVAPLLRRGRTEEGRSAPHGSTLHPVSPATEHARLTVHLSSFRINSIIRAFLVEESKIVKNVLKAQAKAQK